jgi:predicted metal-dependent phosphoesterase TrpH
LIDLHTHSTASDGRCTPGELVARAVSAGVTTLGLTDHDTLAGCAAAADACASAGVAFVPGIEITAVAHERDIHVLAYFVDLSSSTLLAFLGEQRQRRLDRVRAIIERLTALGMPLDADRVLAPTLTQPDAAVGRPWIARALVSAGYVSTVSDAFDSFLSHGRPAFVPRVGAAPADVFEQVHRARGLTSLAHPVLMKHDEWIPAFVDAGLDAIEAFHADHTLTDVERYRALARDFGLLVTGGSDFHGDNDHGSPHPGAVSLPREHYEALLARVR